MLLTDVTHAYQSSSTARLIATVLFGLMLSVLSLSCVV